MSYGQPQDVEVPNGPPDGILSMAFAPNSNFLVAGSWDNQVRIYDVTKNVGQPVSNVVPKAAISHAGPVLCCCWSADGQQVFSAGCDKTAKMWNIAQPGHQGQQIAAHNEAIKCIAHVTVPSPMVVTGSWDKTIKYWDTRQPTAACTVQLTERCYAMDAVGSLLCCATADRKISIYNLASPQQPFKIMDSPLRHQSRCIACFPDQSGFALGSIEGRVAIQYVQDQQPSKNFAFKCHRDNSNNDIYPVNAIAFHKFGTFATAGSDGSFHFWDKDSKQRLKQFNKQATSITACAFNAPGDLFAYAVSYDWCKGAEHANQTNKIMLHDTKENEINKRGKKK
jgi:mRNA export factor